MLSRLYTLLLVIVVAWSSWVVFGGWGVIIFALVSILAAFLYQAKSVLRAIAYFVALLFLIALLLPFVCCAHEAALRMQCSNQLKQIALALLDYEQVYKCFPPAYVADKNGKPMHSWRALILPFMEQQALYRQYDFNEPWNGPNNKKLLAARPRGFACPSDEQANAQDATCTSYVAVVGPNAAWPGEQPRRFGDAGFAENTSSTIMVVEVADAGIHWTEPKDFDVDASETTDSASSGVKVSSKHTRSNGFFYYDTISGATVAMVDGSVRFFPACILTANNLKSLLTIGGLEKNIDSSWGNEELQINWRNCIALAVWLVPVGLLLHQAVRSRKTARQPVAERTN